MGTSRPIAKYHCTQAELYAICTIGWQSYNENQPDFEAFKTTYTAAFGTAMVAAVETAKNLPDFQARNEDTETAYILMGQTATLALTKWRTLRSYIKSAFAPELQKPNIEAAGEEHYTKATTRNWGETELMFTSALNYITENTAILTAAGMPATFPTSFSDLHTTFISHYSTFTDSGQDEHEGTDAKVNSNNSLYDNLQKMFEDGQIIYEENPAKRERFIFARVKELITNNSSTGGSGIPATVVELGVYVYDEETNTPIEGAHFTILNAPGGVAISATSNSEGIVLMRILGFEPNETVVLNGEITADGYESDSGELEATAGNLYSIDASMQPVV